MRFTAAAIVLLSCKVILTSAGKAVPYFCGFEDDCRDDFTITSSADYEWQVYDKRTPTSGTGPYNAYQDSDYMYCEANGHTPGDTSSLTSPEIDTAGEACVEFALHMHGPAIDKLEIHQIDTSMGETEVDIFNSEQSADWVRKRYTRMIAAGDKFRFRATRGANNYGDIAVDAFYIRPGPCSNYEGYTYTDLPYSCGFEGYTDPCFQNMYQVPLGGDQYDWYVHSGPTVTGATGPDSAYENKHFIFAEGSSPRADFDVARIETPRIKHTGNACVNFGYHMEGEEQGEFKVYQRAETDDIATFTEIWMVEGEQDGGWIPMNFNVTLEENDVIGFLVVRGMGSSSDIAIDGLTIEKYNCGEDPPPPPTPPPSGSGDPHILVDIEDQAICYNYHGKDGQSVQLIHDPTTGLTVNAELYKQETSRSTFFKRMAVITKDCQIIAGINGIMVNDKMSKWDQSEWTNCGRSAFSVSPEGKLVVQTSYGVEVTIVREDKMLRHHMEHFVDIFLTQSQGLHENTIGLIGQFQGKKVNVMYPPNSPAPVLSFPGERNSQGLPTRLLYRKNILSGNKVPCWFVAGDGRGLIQGMPEDYVVPRISWNKPAPNLAAPVF